MLLQPRRGAIWSAYMTLPSYSYDSEKGQWSEFSYMDDVENVEEIWYRGQEVVGRYEKKLRYGQSLNHG